MEDILQKLESGSMIKPQGKDIKIDSKSSPDDSDAHNLVVKLVLLIFVLSLVLSIAVGLLFSQRLRNYFAAPAESTGVGQISRSIMLKILTPE